MNILADRRALVAVAAPVFGLPTASLAQDTGLRGLEGRLTGAPRARADDRAASRAYT